MLRPVRGQKQGHDWNAWSGLINMQYLDLRDCQLEEEDVENCYEFNHRVSGLEIAKN